MTTKTDQARVDATATASDSPTAPASVPAPENMRVWSAVARPPVTALKQIKGGRLQGMTDVNPQWRYQAMTEQFGPIGTGWRYTIDKLWTEPCADGEVLAFAQVSVYTRRSIGPNGSFAESEPILGIGGNHLVVKESKGLRNNDECWKMAITDALSVALKMLGVAADIYAGSWDGSKYRDEVAEDKPAAAPTGYDAWLKELDTFAAKHTDGELIAEIAESGSDEFKALLRKDTATLSALRSKAGKNTKRAGVAA